MKLLKIKDNSQLKKENFSDIGVLASKIADKTLEQLEREGVFVFPEIVKDAEDITQNQMILQGINDTYRSGNVMGFLGCGDERLIIESRFCGNGDDYFFQYLLDRVLDFPNIVDLESDANQDNRLFNFLLFLFPYYLKSAMRKGLFKKYINHRYNDGNIKGTIDIARHIKKNTVRHAYFHEYFALQRLCLLILQHQKHQIGSGSKQIYGILFDGAWLWEEYVNSLIEDAFYHPMNKNGNGAQRLFAGNVGLIYPDFISKNTDVRIIADAKYKPMDNIGGHDYLQVLAYMFRFDAKMGYYLYPESEGADDLKLRMNRGSTFESNVAPRDDIGITKHGLKIPVDVADYGEFVKKMKMREQEFTSVFISADTSV